MIAVEFKPENLTGANKVWWCAWLQKARDAAEVAMKDAESNKKLQFRNEVWTELKYWLLENIFNRKCAYCESHVQVSGYGAADHFRPKGGLAGEVRHRGYYWVAYDWRNLVPCCDRCNTGGKRASFPIQGRRVFAPQEAGSVIDLDRIERPFLLNPYDTGEGDPRRHLSFTEFGQVCPKNGSIRGKRSIEAFDLRRPDLKDKRRANQEAAWLRWLFLNGPGNQRKSERKVFWKEIKDGRIEHCAAIADAIREKWTKRLVEIRGVTTVGEK